MRSPSRVVALLGLTLALAVGAVISARALIVGQSASPDVAGVQQAALRGVTLQMDLCRSGRADDLPQPVPVATRSQGPIPARLSTAEANAVIDGCVARIDKIFTGTAVRDRLKGSVSGLADMYADEHVRDLGAGVSAIEFPTVRVGATTASADAKTHVWSHSLVQGPDGRWVDSCPEGDLLWHLELVKSADGTWLIESMTGARADGGGP